MGCVYRLEFPNGKSYVGITASTAEKRFATHWKNRLNAEKNHLPLYKALLKYGRDAVKVITVLEFAEWEVLCACEIASIETHQTLVPFGYNVSTGGEGVQGVKLTLETREKMRRAATAAWRRPEHQKRMSAMRTGRTQPEATRQKRSDSVAKMWADPEWRHAMLEARRLAKLNRAESRS